jgi:hypothetical protein
MSDAMDVANGAHLPSMEVPLLDRPELNVPLPPGAILTAIPAGTPPPAAVYEEYKQDLWFGSVPPPLTEKETWEIAHGIWTRIQSLYPGAYARLLRMVPAAPVPFVPLAGTFHAELRAVIGELHRCGSLHHARQTVNPDMDMATLVVCMAPFLAWLLDWEEAFGMEEDLPLSGATNCDWPGATKRA